MQQEVRHNRHVRHAAKADYTAILGIYAHARAVMKRNGNPSQWGDVYPLDADVLHDIELHRSMLLVDQSPHDGSERILGVFAACQGPDSTYAHIDGAWLNDDDYVAMHRVASSGLARKTGKDMLDWAVHQYRNVRADTHEKNAAMQHILTSAGFTRCGIITLPPREVGGRERIAYQRHI
ncbi:N-acetyltransferase [Bifidobacterium aquikefiri]|uniref:N-acetyltransferase n=1 Tax=Bifidobacterium aquikefiri TaxID=1653207 RepID=UPI0023F4C45F|nr:N-acetyltransferase [Bifidobacterium aquikefiri]